MADKTKTIETVTDSEKQTKFKADVEFKCPFCDGTVAASREQMAVLHTLPMCQRYSDEEPDVFLTSCREKMERS